ncbi:nuclear-interacting partner of ALK isoform X2 [Rhinatrema bivittatum]|uniref:nuclear-interacting partner of ALK isoform X2 n=1 Tax=Rhinatrema bivittatum TaxID=194408 RepID=UPI00112705A2|nr:nuclear-interacting partner of ALK isoform X2 [Rhinatrema bivittatum]
MMAAPSSAAAEGENSGARLKSPAGTPQKIRELINEGIAGTTEGRDLAASPGPTNGSLEADVLPCETVRREAFFSRVETYTSLKWAGKPPELSPLVCAQYGWTNVECDMLKCSSCQAFLCTTMQTAFSFRNYKERCAELLKALRMAHENFCFWPDSPCPDRFWLLLMSEPSVLLGDFLARFQSLCHLELQLPSLKLDDLKNMGLSEDTLSLLLHLTEDELQQRGEDGRTALKYGSDNVPVHIAACVLALCGWTGNSPLGSLHLSIITCCRCMRKVGLWGFQQIEGTGSGETDIAPGMPITSVTNERGTPVPLSPHRMTTRSKDTGFPQSGEQHELSQTPVLMRTRSGEFPGPLERSEAEAVRNRPVTRSMGQGDCALGSEVPSSPHKRTKRARLCSSSSSDTSSPRGFFDPLAQHRDWCPWVSVAQEVQSGDLEKGDQLSTAQLADPAWRALLKILLAMSKSHSSSETDSESVPEKSRKVFQIFRQWQEVPCSS